MAQVYGRFANLATLRLDTLSRAIQQQGGSPYATDLYDRLLEHAVLATSQLQDNLGWELLPWSGVHYIECPEPRKILPLEAWLIAVEQVTSVYRRNVDEVTETIMEDSLYYHDPTTSYVDWIGAVLKGRFNVTGLWGMMSPMVFDRSLIGTAVATVGETLAGATSVVLASEIRCRGGEVFWDATGKQVLIANSNSGTTVQLDQWGTPETTIATATDLTLCGKLDADVERMVLLGAYLDAWRAVTASPESGALVGERADKHEYKLGTGGSSSSRPSPMSSYQQEWAEKELMVKRVKAPMEWT